MIGPAAKLREAIREIGYSAIVEDYTFSDVFAASANTTRTVSLAAFTHTPETYRSAAMAVVTEGGHGPAAAVREHSALGAPLFFVIERNQVSVWQAYANAPPRLLDRVELLAVSHLFESNRPVWNPQAIHRAKLIGHVDTSYQLDFVDLGLLPAIEGQISEKLDRLLAKALEAATGSPTIRPRDLFHGIFRLLAAKILQDRRHTLASKWKADQVSSVLAVIGEYYRLPTQFDLKAMGASLRASWNILSNGVSVANISAEDLAFVYENTLVTPEARRELGTHSTPRHVAEYVVSRLGLWSYASNPPTVFEPFAGAGVFLVSALRHMREALPEVWSDARKHEALVKKLAGTEIDSFASEVATLSLILADYPNRNGWKIETSDLFSGDLLKKKMANADVILCNPPFEAFDADQRTKYQAIAALSGAKAEAVLMAALQSRPKALGFVLPRAFLMDRAYSEHRQMISDQFAEIELVSLPDGVFAVSKIETALLIARGRREVGGTQVLRSAEVRDSDRETFRRTGLPSEVRETKRILSDDRLWITPLRPLWDRLQRLPRLGQLLEGHWGIRWLDKRQGSAASHEQGSNRARGVLHARDHRQFALGRRLWLDVNPDHLYGGGELPWALPKILCNAARLSRGPWRLAAVVDRDKLVASQQFVGLWPKSDNVDLDACAAILNSPVANAYLNDHSADKRLRIATLLALPIPETIPTTLGPLARAYTDEIKNRKVLGSDARLAELLDSIDVLLLEAYDLPPRLVRSLLSSFRKWPRPLVHEWTSWPISTDSPALAPAEIRNGLRFASGDWVKAHLKPVPKSEAKQAAEYLP
jgi:type I restriction-modification system DNA methylase subunit